MVSKALGYSLLSCGLLSGAAIFGAGAVRADEPPKGVSMFSGRSDANGQPMPTVTSRAGRSPGEADVRTSRDALRPQSVSHVRKNGVPFLGASGADAPAGMVPERVPHEPSPGAIQRSSKLNEEGVELVLQGDQVKGAQKLRAALDAYPENTTALYNLAGVKLSQSRTKEAIQLMEKAVALAPRDPSFLTRMAECQFADSNVPQSIYYFERVMAEDERFGDTAFRLGTLYAMVKEWNRAEEMLRKAMEHSPRDVRTLNNLGNVLVVRERFSEAIEVLAKAQKIKPSPENSVSLGIAYEANKEPLKAVAQFKEAQKLGDGSADLKKHISELEQELKPGSGSAAADSAASAAAGSPPATSPAAAAPDEAGAAVAK